MVGCARLPLQAQAGQVERLLAIAGLERGDLGGIEARAAAALEVVEHLRPSLRERLQRPVRDAGDLRHPILRLAPLDPERAGQLEPQLGLVEVAGREPVLLQDRLAVERAPLPVARGLGHVGDDHVGVQVRVLRPRGAVLIGSRDEPGAALAHDPVLAPAGHARLLLEVCERRLPGRQMRQVDRVPNLLASERMQEADALRRREHQVVTGDRRQRLLLQPALTRGRIDPLDRNPLLRRMRAEHGGTERMAAADQPPELALTDDPLQLELSRTTAHPHPRRLAPARVVVVDPRRNRALVIRLLARRQLRHRQH